MAEKLDFAFPVADEMREHVSEIVAQMSSIYGISGEKALAILNDHWATIEIGPRDIIRHEEPDYWARCVFEAREFSE